MTEAVLILAIVLCFGGMFSLWRGWRHLVARRPLRAGGRGSIGLILLAVATLASLAALDLAGYQRLTAERPVAVIRFAAAGPATYTARLTTAFGETASYRLLGQDWRLDARVLKWRAWATLLGFEPLYQLRRLSGRYASVADAQSRPHTVYAIGHDRGLDVWMWARRLHLSFVDAVYGSSVYLPMAAGAEYRVSLGPTGLIARPENEAARQAVAGWR
ncbi:hypothetical protein BI364_03140 [Acidihalobacter yilgarnensis]|uniref:Cation/multidrug efflux pump n=1 Tax=Acidihalobacter yilgarnensis TaxID=2819280 RepID=A0A1D8IKX7_9GAMM|nr:hypothetical protein [Acidihalobacter yilgarnensis]AOU97129.1 hypothetical protein BI364_03140 [Acidihalobacter yilgarnensis]